MAYFDVDLYRGELTYDPPDKNKKIGVIALSTDVTAERDLVRILPMYRLGLYVTRVEFSNPTTPQNLHKMAPLISKAAGLILPDERLDAICYCCTAASVVIGDHAIEASVHTARPGVPVVTPSAAAVQALKAFGAKHISVVTPYLIETSQPMASYFEAQGLSLAKFLCLGLESDVDMARVDRESIIKAVLASQTQETDAFFLSCTALQALDVVREIEAQTGLPVVTSNQACAWALAHHTQIKVDAVKWGRLFRQQWPYNS